MSQIRKTCHVLNTTELEEKLAAFADERHWEQFHTPKNLALALVGEVGELCELLQWKSDEQIDATVISSEAFADEIADILIYTVRLATVAGIDLNDSVRRKIEANEARYPADQVRGSSEKRP